MIGSEFRERGGSRHHLTGKTVTVPDFAGPANHGGDAKPVLSLYSAASAALQMSIP